MTTSVGSSLVWPTDQWRMRLSYAALWHEFSTGQGRRYGGSIALTSRAPLATSGVLMYCTHTFRLPTSIQINLCLTIFSGYRAGVGLTPMRSTGYLYSLLGWLPIGRYFRHGRVPMNLSHCTDHMWLSWVCHLPSWTIFSYWTEHSLHIHHLTIKRV